MVAGWTSAGLILPEERTCLGQGPGGASSGEVRGEKRKKEAHGRTALVNYILTKRE